MGGKKSGSKIPLLSITSKTHPPRCVHERKNVSCQEVNKEFYYLIALDIRPVSQIISIKSVALLNRRYRRWMLMIYYPSSCSKFALSFGVTQINKPLVEAVPDMNSLLITSLLSR